MKILPLVEQASAGQFLQVQQVMGPLYSEGYTSSRSARSNALDLCPSETSPVLLFEGKASFFVVV